MFDFENVALHWANRLSFSSRNELLRRFRQAGLVVTPKEWAILLLLWKEGSSTPSEIAEVTVRDRTSVSRLVDGMVRKGLVEREPDPADRRRTLLRPSARGQQLQSELVPIAQGLIAEAMHGIPPEDARITMRTLRTMTENLTARASAPSNPGSKAE